MKRMIDEESGAASPSSEEAANNDQTVEHLNRSGAMALARCLEQYWHDRGYFNRALLGQTHTRALRYARDL